MSLVCEICGKEEELEDVVMVASHLHVCKDCIKDRRESLSLDMKTEKK
ncbi:hypothetical protein [Thermoflavimicrobium daqui]|jgi:ribosome-binding protein aMBF1 (putative translation factor)|nr:hypothetical protein [Thermoflavimicrobium daqui]